MTIHRKALFYLFLFIPLHAWASEQTTQIEKWSATKHYKRGDLAEHKQTAYIALLPSKNIAPKKISLLWRPIQLDNKSSPKVGKLYLLGMVVVEDNQRFIAKNLNIFTKKADLKDNRKWVLYSGEALPPDTPDDSSKQLLGLDENNNGVRDDYEQIILASELSDRAKQHALQAGKAYGSTMKLSLAKNEITIVQAQATMQIMIHAYRCKIQIAKEEELSWRESDFYDDIDRLEVKLLFSHYLNQLAGNDYLYDFPKDACASFASMMEAE